MSRLIITARAIDGIERCRLFLQSKNPLAARSAAQAIKQQLAWLENRPMMGKPLEDYPALREIIIPYGHSGYVGLYRYDQPSETVYLLAFRHQKEAGY